MPAHIVEFDSEIPAAEMRDALQDAESRLAVALLGAVWLGADMEFIDFLVAIGDRISRAITIAEDYHTGDL